jgi:hypothetical protein
LNIALVEDFRNRTFSARSLLYELLMERGTVVGEKMQYRFLIDFRHIHLKIADERPIAIIKLKLIDLSLLHLQKFKLLLF